MARRRAASPLRAPATAAPSPRSMASTIALVAVVRQFLTQLGEMATGDVAGLMREHANQLIGGLGINDRARIDEDAAAIDDEGVERAVIDDDDTDILLAPVRRRVKWAWCIRAAIVRISASRTSGMP